MCAPVPFTFVCHRLPNVLFSLLLGNRKQIRKPYRGVATRWNSDHEEVKHTNIMMGDLYKALSIMLSEEGCDFKLLEDKQGRLVCNKQGNPVKKTSLMFTQTDHMILQQYECAAEPALLLSKKFQLSIPTAHLVLINLRVRIAQMREPQFSMYGDISHSTILPVITDRKKTETVVSDDVTERDDGPVVPMMDCIETFRAVFADDLELRCGLTVRNKTNPDQLEPARSLPSDIAIAALLHPLLGGKCLDC